MARTVVRLGLAAVSILSGALALASAADAAPRERARRIHGALDVRNSALPRYQKAVEVFVRLDVPAVSELVALEQKAGRALPSPARQLEQLRAVDNQQRALRPALEARGARVVGSLRVGVNGLRLRVKPSELAALRALPGVRSVGWVTRYRPLLQDSVPWVGAPAVQQKVAGGKGVSIAIIDSGIDYTHADFGGSGDPTDFATNDPDVIEPGTFPTRKVAFGYDFAGTLYDADSDDSALNTPVPDPDPIDENAHGTHVAGIAAGIGVPGSVGRGVANAATLWSLKVFGQDGSSEVVSEAVELALDPNRDGSVDDHADVINLSLGSDYGDANDPTAIATQNAAELGVIVVAAAGNSGDVPYVHSSPAIAPAVISVAASVPGRDAASFVVNTPASEAGPFAALEGDGPARVKDVAPLAGTLVPADPLDACGPLTNGAAIAGEFAFVIRGTCSFDAKYTNAEAAGARAIVVFNDGTSPTRVDPITMGGISPTRTIPGVMIASTKGLALLAASEAGAAVTATLGIAFNVFFADTIASFSSRGPGASSVGKPDVSAPGDEITSAGIGGGSAPLVLGGTSMAAPHVAGEAALLHALHPRLDPSAIKALIQNATVASLVGGLDGDSPFAVARQGTGVIRVDAAARLTSFASPASVSFGRVEADRIVLRTAFVEVENFAGRARRFRVKHVPGQTFPGVQVRSLRDSLVLGPRGRALLPLLLEMKPIGPADAGLFSQTEVDGWFVLSDGREELRVSYLAAVDPMSGVRARARERGKLVVSNTGPTEGLAEGFTLLAEGGLVLESGANALRAFGVRTSDFGFPVVEFGVATQDPWDSLSAFEIDLFIDANEDGDFETVLVAADVGLLTGGDPTGEIVTAIFSPTAAELLFTASGDLNDASVVLPFVRSDFGLGFLDPGDTHFDYQLAMFDTRSGTFDVQEGSVELADEIIPDQASVVVSPRSSVELSTSGPRGDLLWLFQNNPAERQAQVVTTH